MCHVEIQYNLDMSFYHKLMLGDRTWDSNGNGAEMEHLPAHLWEAFQNNTWKHRAGLKEPCLDQR